MSAEQIRITKREMELLELGALDGYEIYKEQQKKLWESRREEEAKARTEKIEKIEKTLTDEQLKGVLGYLYHPTQLEQYIKSSDGREVSVRLTQKEKALYELGALSQERIDELCYEKSPISFWKIKQAILRHHQKNDKGER